LARSRVLLRSRLEKQRPRVEQALLARVYGIADPTEISDADYVAGFRAAASAALDFVLSIIDDPDAPEPLIPPVLLSQARLAARNGVPIDTVLRRYTAGHAVLIDFLVEEVQRDQALAAQELRRLLAYGSSGLDHLLSSVSEEYARELRSRQDFSMDRRRALHVERLLAGEPIDATEFGYPFEAHHVALIGEGAGVQQLIRHLSSSIGCRLLFVGRDDATSWAWLGTRRPLDPADVLKKLDAAPKRLAIAVGERGQGLHGWRRSHRQAEAARVVVRQRDGGPIRYADVALLASMLQDDLLQTSLHELYLAPLEQERDGGAALRATLRAYFAAERNISSAAAALEVDRRTVANRLRVIESRLPRPLGAALPDIEAALKLEPSW
jgi:hypothetical protein